MKNTLTKTNMKKTKKILSKIHLQKNWKVIAATIVGAILLVVVFGKMVMAIVDPAPQITLIDPNFGPVTGNNPVRITGVNFYELTAVRFNGQPVTITAFDTNTIDIIAPPHAQGDVDVQVDAHGMQVIKRLSYTYMSNNPPGTEDNAIGLKQEAMTDMQNILATLSDKQEAKQLEKAIGYIKDSMNPSYWVDQNHLNYKQGKFVFIKEKDAVNALSERMNKGSIPSDVLQKWIDGLVKADKTLASVAIADAVAANGDANYTAEAQKDFADGNAKAGEGKPNEAIMKYSGAWEKAIRAIGKN